MTDPDDDSVEYLSDEEIINLPSTSISGEQAPELERRIEEIAEDSLSEDNPEFHALPLYMNWRLQRERDHSRRDQEQTEREAYELEDRRLHKHDKREYEGFMSQLVIRFQDVAKRACKLGLALLGREMEIRNRAIVLDDGRRVYVNGTGFVDESGRSLTDSSAVTEAQEKKKSDSATAPELQVADRAHSLAQQERAVEQQASHGAQDTDSSRRAAAGMTPDERTVTAASAGQHADELDRTQTITEQQARDLLNSSAASLAGGVAGGAARLLHEDTPAALPSAGTTRGTSSPDSSEILTGLRKTFAAALGSAVGSVSAPDSTADTSSLRHEFAVAIARPRNDNSSTRTTATVDSIPSARSATF